MLTFELSPDGEAMFVHGDAPGLRRLAENLHALAASVENGAADHFHLMSADWGGSELSTTCQALEPGWRCMHHVKLFAWPSTKSET